MASEEELNRQDQLNEKLKQQVGINEDIFALNQNIGNDILNQIKGLENQLQTKRDIRKLSSEANRLAKEALNVDLQSLGTQKNIDRVQKQQSTAQDTINNLKRQENALTGISGDANKLVIEAIQDQIAGLKETQKVLNKTEQASKNIADNLGVKVTGALSDVVSAIPGLNRFSGPFKNAAEEARSVAASTGSSSKALAAGAKSLAKSAVAALPLLALTTLVNVFLKLDKSTGNLAKNLGVSFQQATRLQGEFSNIASSSNNIFQTTENLSSAFIDINNSLGTNAKLNDDLLKTQVELVKQAGYSTEAANEISRLSLATGASSRGITTEFLGQVRALNIQNDLAINEKTLLNDIQNISKGTLATFAGQVDELAAASFKARQLGLELKQLEGIADGLLDIESSLAAEFEAEVISGKQINLERARFFALTNDIGALAEEIGKNEEIINAFSSGTRIEQEAIAKSLGMSRDELGDMVIERKAINQLQGIEGKTAQERFNNLVKEVGLEEAKRRLGDETLANQLASVSTQEKFQQTISRLQDAFVKLALPLLPIVDAFVEIFGIVVPLIRLFDPLIQAVRVLAAGVADIVTAFKNLITLNFSGLKSFGSQTMDAFIQGSDSIAQSYGLENPQNTQDGIAPASRGPFTVMDSFGATAITARGDGLAVSPNITREDRNTSGTVTLSDAQIQKIANAVRDGASRATINLDGDKVSSRLQTPTVLNTLPGV